MMREIRQGLFLICSIIILFSCNRNHTSENITGIRALPVDSFLNSIGINTAIYTRGESLDKTIECVKYCGFRWIRSGYEGTPYFNKLVYQRLHDEAGVRFSYGLMSGGTDIERIIKDARRLAQIGALLAIEGNNEPNNWGVNYKNRFGGRDSSWIPVAELQRDLYLAVKNDSILSDYPVFGISASGAEWDNVGLQYLTIPKSAGTLMPNGTQYADYANCHNYSTHPSWPGIHDNQTWNASSPYADCKVDGLIGNYGQTWMKKFTGYSEAGLESLPRVTTETGLTQNEFISEDMQARILLNLYLAQFKRGWSYTSVYLLRDRTDEEGNQTFGFYAPDYTPRRSAHYLHNLTTILNDSNPIKKLSSLDYTIPDCPETVHDLLLQKSNGNLYLIVWGERYTGGEDKITISLGETCKQVNIYDPTFATDAVDDYQNVSTIDLSLRDTPFILEIKK